MNREYVELVRQIEAQRAEIERLKTHDALRTSEGTWTPTVTQGVGVAVTVTAASYRIVGKICHTEVILKVTGAGTGGVLIIIGGQPAIIQPTNILAEFLPIGICGVFDVGTAFYYGFVTPQTATDWRLRDSNTQNHMGVNPNFALANGDYINFTATYLVA
jgi:hypothetical protein